MLCVVLPTLFSLALPISRDCALGGKAQALGVLPLLPLPTVMSLSPIELALPSRRERHIVVDRQRVRAVRVASSYKEKVVVGGREL